MKFIETVNKIEYNVTLARVPFTIMHAMVLLIICIFQINRGMSWQQLILAIILFSLYNTVHWFSNLLLPILKSGYFILLGLIILFLTLLIPASTIIIVLGLMPVFAVQGILYYEEKWRGIALVVGYYVFGSIMIYINFAFEDLFIFIVLFTSMLTFMAIIIQLFNQQKMENEKLQFYVEELKIANQKIEQLTLKNERQRMARDLHDTLAQRLVGLVLKLEASEIHLQQGNIEKSENIIKSAILQAKQSVQEARNVIDNLREQESLRTFLERVSEEVEELQLSTNAKIDFQTNKLIELPITLEEHILSIVSEAVHNAQKHSNASKINISLNIIQDELVLTIHDNGIGIDLNEKYKQGHYGILGMEERAKLMHGTFLIDSENGTKIKVVIPLK